MQTRVGFKCASCTGQTAAGGGESRRRLLLLAGGALAMVVGGLVVAGVVGGEGPPTEGPAPAASPVSAERNVQFDGADGLTLGATLGLPAGAAAGDGLGAVVILPGFGPTDRNGLYPPGRPADPLYRDLSETLVDGGMVTFRYDKRGTGQSVLPPSDTLTFDDMVADAAAAVDFVAERAEIDAQRIAVVGHEEGGLVALQLAASDPRIASVVLVSVPGRPLVEVVADDFRNSGHGEDVEDLEAVVASLLAGEELPEPGALPASVRGFFPVGQGEYARGLFSIDPVTLARRVDVPTLVVRGERATGISADDAEALVGALGDEAQPLVAPDAGHTLLISDPADETAPAESDSSEHAGPSGAGSGFGHRDENALTRIRDFLASTLA
ncbi:MAG: alpha/beta hydrolase [Actinobacteria bacterium]|nr:alpha/beta hydrolase [Actinomycetota bacterium]